MIKIPRTRSRREAFWSIMDFFLLLMMMIMMLMTDLYSRLWICKPLPTNWRHLNWFPGTFLHYSSVFPKKSIIGFLYIVLSSLDLAPTLSLSVCDRHWTSFLICLFTYSLIYIDDLAVGWNCTFSGVIKPSRQWKLGWQYRSGCVGFLRSFKNLYEKEKGVPNDISSLTPL